MDFFKKEYWQANYSEPETMDGIGNCLEHSKYLSSLMKLEMIQVKSIIDFGCGFGDLFLAFLKEFKPYRSMAIEPSKFAFEKAREKIEKSSVKGRVKVQNLSIQKYFASEVKKKNFKPFDLGICTSVFQYLSDDELEKVLQEMSRSVKYLYMTAPTNKELDYQINELNFKDEYAIRRSRTKYQKLISKNFTVVSNRLLESKFFFDESNTPFTEYIYRF